MPHLNLATSARESLFAEVKNNVVGEISAIIAHLEKSDSNRIKPYIMYLSTLMRCLKPFAVNTHPTREEWASLFLKAHQKTICCTRQEFSPAQLQELMVLVSHLEAFIQEQA